MKREKKRLLLKDNSSNSDSNNDNTEDELVEATIDQLMIDRIRARKRSVRKRVTTNNNAANDDKGNDDEDDDDDLEPSVAFAVLLDDPLRQRLACNGRLRTNFGTCTTRLNGLSQIVDLLFQHCFLFVIADFSFLQ